MTRPAINKAFAVGLLVAVGVLAFFVAFTFFRKGGYAERDTYTVFAYFEDATGLTWKSRVQIAGIQVGEVERIGLEGNRARLTLRIKNEIDLRQDACLTKRFPSTLLPDALLEAAPGSTKAASLRALPPERREITCINEGASVAKLIDSMSKIASDIQGVTRELQGLVVGNEGSVKQIIENLARVSGRLDQATESGQAKIAAILDNTESFTRTLSQVAATDRERYHAIARNIESASARLDKVLASVQDILGEPGPEGAAGGGEVKRSVADAREAIKHINASMEEIEKVAKNIGQGKGVAGKLLADEQLGEKVGQSIDVVADYVYRLNKLQVKVDLRSEWLLNQSGSKTYASFAIIPRPDKYYLFEIVNDPRGVDTQTTEQVTTQSGGVTTVTQTTRVLNEQKVRFSAEFAKRYGPMTFRIGVIESSGGVGADLHLLDDALKLSVNFYQFTRPTSDVFPRSKLWIDYNFLRYFYATMGADDFLNQWRAQRFPAGPKFNIGRDVFFGGGIVFTDDDLKTLLGFAGGGATAVVR
ncbi:MAG TPA: MlaD family protein [Anaeromyxobacteraceae bacterium]|nr:MlaD family protein [Anaeromyxobacteraceae bacterium]